MAIITNTQTLILVDKLLKQYTLLRGYYAADPITVGAGDGTYGASRMADDIIAIVNGYANKDSGSFLDTDLEIALNPPAAGIKARCLASQLIGGVQYPFFYALSNLCALNRVTSATIYDLDSFLAWCNEEGVTTTDRYKFQLPPLWWELYNAILGGDARPSPENVCAEELMLTNGTGNGGVASLTYDGTLAAGAIVTFSGATPTHTWTGGVTDGADVIKYRGGWPYLNWTSVTNGANPTGVITITVTGLNQSGVSKTWIFSGTWGTGDWLLAAPGNPIPATSGTGVVAGDIMASVTNIAGTGVGFSTASAGKFVIESRLYNNRSILAT